MQMKTSNRAQCPESVNMQPCLDWFGRIDLLRRHSGILSFYPLPPLLASRGYLTYSSIIRLSYKAPARFGLGL